MPKGLPKLERERNKKNNDPPLEPDQSMKLAKVGPIFTNTLNQDHILQSGDLNPNTTDASHPQSSHPLLSSSWEG